MILLKKEFLVPRSLAVIIFSFFAIICTAQKEAKDSLKQEKKEIREKKRKARKQAKDAHYDVLSPSKAAFYSAVLPGMGQVYNKKYWKLPIVYGLIGGGLYFYSINNTDYNRYRDAFKRRLAGFTDDEFYDLDGNGIGPDVSEQALRDAQEVFQRNRDLSLLLTVVFYVLNIIDANVDAHLKRFSVDDDLSFKPYLRQHELHGFPSYGLSLNLRF